MNVIYNLQKNISEITEGLPIFENIVPPIAYEKAKDDKKVKSKEDSIPNNELGNPPDDDKDPNKKGKKEKEKKNAGKKGKIYLEKKDQVESLI